MTSASSTDNNVLVIDDDPLQRELMRSYFLSKNAQNVRFAGNGKEAAKQLEQHGPSLDLMMVDLNMPDFDGIEFLRLLHERACHIPFIIVSGATPSVFQSAEVLAHHYRLNLLGALKKPVRFRDLERLLQARAVAAAAPASLS